MLLQGTVYTKLLCGRFAYIPCTSLPYIDLSLPPCRGTEEQYGMSGSVDIINSTLGKALGGAAGGYTVGPLELTTLLRQRSRPYLFSNSLPPPVVAGAIKVCVVCVVCASVWCVWCVLVCGVCGVCAI